MSPASRLGLIPCERKRARARGVKDPASKRARPSAAGACASGPRAKRKRACAVKDGASKRTRPPAAGASEPRSPWDRDWAWLQEDLLRLVAWRVLAGDNGMLDYVRFRLVCRHWCSTAACPRGRGVVDPRFHPRHWRMLPEGYGLYPGHRMLGGWVRFVNLRTGALARLHLPLFRDHFAMDSVDGILLLQRDSDMVVRLLNPFTGDVVNLPSLAPLTPRFSPYCRNLVASISASPGGVITAMLAYGAEYNCESHVAFATSKDHQWALSSWKTKLGEIILPFEGRLYFFTPGLHFFVIDPGLQQQQDNQGSSSSSLLPPPKLIATCPPDKIYGALYLVECDSEVLLVGKSRSPMLGYDLIYRLSDLIMGKFIPLNCIGGNSLLLSRCRSLCVSSKVHPTIAGDTIVSITGSLGRYHIKSGTWSPATDCNVVNGPIPSPYSLIHHIYTCCHNSYWNKGRIYCQNNKYDNHSRWPVKRRGRIGG